MRKQDQIKRDLEEQERQKKRMAEEEEEARRLFKAEEEQRRREMQERLALSQAKLQQSLVPLCSFLFYSIICVLWLSQL